MDDKSDGSDVRRERPHNGEEPRKGDGMPIGLCNWNRSDGELGGTAIAQGRQVAGATKGRGGLGGSQTRRGVWTSGRSGHVDSV